MELTEISDRIDIMLNAFEVPIEVDEYEKSIYLTKAQTVVHKQLCDAFEIDGGISSWLQPYVKEFATGFPVQTVTRNSQILNSTFILVPEDIYKVIQETAYLGSTITKFNNRKVNVLKSRVEDILYKLESPFRKPNEKEIVRIVTNDTNSDTVFELVLPDNTNLLKYQCKYIQIPQPIILEPLPDGLTIFGESGPLNTLFDDDIMERIIEIAVMTIKQDKTVMNQQNV